MKHITDKKEIAKIAAQLTNENKAYVMAVIRALIFAQKANYLSNQQKESQEAM